METLTREERENTFTNIYKTNYWASKETRSGVGSERANVEYYGEHIKHLLTKVITEKPIKRIIDIGCGECTSLPDWITPDIEYYGVDICEDIIKENILNSRNNNRKNTKFFFLDILSCPMTSRIIYELIKEVDIVLLRDVLIHYNNADAIQIIFHICYCWGSGDTLLVINHNPGLPDNSERNIKTGDYSPINLRKPPFTSITHDIIHISKDLKSGGRELITVKI